MYYTDNKGNISSYISGVSYSNIIQNALNGKNDENRRLSTTSGQDESFEKQKMVQEAINQLKMTGTVSSDIAKEVNVEELKKSLETSDVDNESEASKMLSGASNSKKSSVSTSKVDNSTQTEALKQAAYDKLSSASETQDIKALDEAKKEDEDNGYINIGQNQTSFFEKEIVKSSSNAPQDVSEAAKNAFNPLETNENSSPNSVSFVDEVSGKNISVPLSEENAKAIKEKFGSLDSKEAQDYVKAWYYDAAYSMGYLEQDKDGNGTLSLDEGIHINSLVSLKDSKYYSVADRIPGGEDMQKKFLEQVGFFDNLGDFINHAISQDTNLDGSLNLKEMMGEKEELVLFKTSGASGNTLDIYVLKHYKIDIENNVDDTLINLGNNTNNKKEDEDVKEDKNVELLRSSEYKNWIEEAKSLINGNYLDSLNDEEKNNLLKSDTILQNLLDNKMSA